MSSAIVPAAGAATRFGTAKLAAPLNGQLLLDRTIRALLDAGLTEVIVVIPPGSEWTAAVQTLHDSRVRTLVNPDPARGMLSSIQVGAGAATSSPLVVLPADMPFVSAETVRQLLARSSDSDAIVSPRFQGRRGHPVVLPSDLKEPILAASRASTLKDVLQPYASRFVDVPVDDPGVIRDVDTQDDLRP